MAVYKNSVPFGNIVTDGLVLNLDATNINSYPGSGTTWTDTSFYRNSGTLTNGPTFLRERGRGSIVFDGVDDYVNIPNKFMTGYTAFTFNVWVRLSSSAGGTLCCYNVPTLHSGPQLNFTTSLIQLIVYNGNGSSFIYNSGQSISNSLNTWYNVTSTWIPGTIKLYVNGIDYTAPSNVTSGIPPTSIQEGASTVAFKIGTGLLNQTLYVSGNIATTQVYNRALSASEVQQNFNALKSRFGL